MNIPMTFLWPQFLWLLLAVPLLVLLYLWLLRRKKRTRVFQGKRIPDIVTSVLVEATIAAAGVADAR